jgi:siroheme synthase-like protein
VAARRVPLLVEAGAAVTVVAPALDPALRLLVDSGRCAYLARPYAVGDCLGMFLVLAATGLPEVDAEVAAEARTRGALACVASNQAQGNCLFMATVRRGPLVVALHTDGAAPAVTAALRRRLDAQLPDRLGDALDALAEIRGRLRTEVGDPDERARRWRLVVESGALDRLLAQADLSVLEEIRMILTDGEHTDRSPGGDSTIPEQLEYL